MALRSDNDVRFSSIDDDALVSFKTVSAWVGLSRWTLRRMVLERRFAAPAEITGRTHRWRAGDIRVWIREHRP